jgi:hypothetical protein
MLLSNVALLLIGLAWAGVGAPGSADCTRPGASAAGSLCVQHDQEAGTISIFRSGETQPILTQVAQEHVRPYIHPIVAPDGRGVLTQYRPEHHRHQTGLYWGLKSVNGRDYFMACCLEGRSQSDYYRRVSAGVLEDEGEQVKWQTVYDLLDENGNTTLTETQTWAMREEHGRYVLDLAWVGEAKTDITFGKFYVGGLFLRMPWHEQSVGEVINAAGQRNNEAEAQRAIWTDVGILVEGRDDLAHIAFLDHPVNTGFPISWRVDGELGVGPSLQIMGDWKLARGEAETFRYRLLAYTGKLDHVELSRAWTEYATSN